MPVLTGIDVLGIQRYVFASNRLRDVLAASWMVRHVTEQTTLCQINPHPQSTLLAAGGNAILEFANLVEAKQWTARYTRRLLEEAPGLEVALVHLEYAPGKLAAALKALAIRLARAKLQRRPHAPQLGLGVTAACSITGQPATTLDRKEGAPLSLQIQRLRDNQVQQEALARWDQFLQDLVLQHASCWTPQFPQDLDRMGRTFGETSLVGVVHVDGNGVGQAITAWLERCIDEELDDDTVREQYEEWSDAIDKLGRSVLQAIVQRVADCVVAKKDSSGQGRPKLCGTPPKLGFPLCEFSDPQTPHSVFLPLRPILLGGDDLTLVCDGRIALDLAATALREFETPSIPHLGEGGKELKLTACAGVALVRAHAPFYRSYQLAESLCTSAKRTRRKQNQELGTETGGWLDWHLGPARPGEAIHELRDREYQNQNGCLTMRPYPLRAIVGRGESWEWFDQQLLGPGLQGAARQGFRGMPVWVESRNRIKRLGTLVVEGGGAVARQLAAWRTIEKGISLPGGLPDSGFPTEKTPLLDAVELLDVHMRLEPGAETDRNPPA